MKLYGGIDLHSNNSVPALLDDEGIKAKIIRHDDQLGQWNYVIDARGVSCVYVLLVCDSILSSSC